MSLKWVFLVVAIVLVGCESTTQPVYLGPNDPDQMLRKRWELVGYTTLSGRYSDSLTVQFAFELDSLRSLTCYVGEHEVSGICSIDPAFFRFDSISQSIGSFLPSMSNTVSYKQRDSALLVLPQHGEYVHLFFKAR
jgi:hypothetical protein